MKGIYATREGGIDILKLETCEDGEILIISQYMLDDASSDSLACDTKDVQFLLFNLFQALEDEEQLEFFMELRKRYENHSR